MSTEHAPSTAPSERFEAAIARIDSANADDPHTLMVDGVARPKELTHARMMTEWVRRLRPDAAEALLLAARAHHIRRWEIARSSYPAGRSGYLRWRTRLHRFHAEQVGTILADVGYDGATIEHVQRIVRKQGLRSDPDVQTLEDALALVFLQTQLDALTAQVDDDPKMLDVIRKTWVKMTPAGQAAALELRLSGVGRAIVERALAAE